MRISAKKINTYYMPSERAERVLNFQRLDGGLNLYDLPYRLGANESPEMKNLMWIDGALGSRNGQRYLYEDDTLGVGYASWRRPWHGCFICHIGRKLYAFPVEGGEPEEVYAFGSAWTPSGGVFFPYDDSLYYKASGVYIKISYLDSEISAQDMTGTDESGNPLAYTPVTIINASPQNGSGDEYQPENRLSPAKTIWYNASDAGTRRSSITLKGTSGGRTNFDFSIYSVNEPDPESIVLAPSLPHTTTVTADGSDPLLWHIAVTTTTALGTGEYMTIVFTESSRSYFLPVRSADTTIRKIVVPSYGEQVYTGTVKNTYQDRKYSSSCIRFLMNGNVYFSSATLELKRNETASVTVSVNTATGVSRITAHRTLWGEAGDYDCGHIVATTTGEILFAQCTLTISEEPEPEAVLTETTAVLTEEPLAWNSAWDGDFAFWAPTGRILFKNLPVASDPPTGNEVRVTYSLANDNALNSVLSCDKAITFGAERGLCVVLGGCDAQPNAYFWNANDNLSMNAGYFPMTNYNFAGDANEALTGFGIQQSQLIIFKEGSVGKASMSMTQLDGRESITMNYTPINAEIGCDVPNSIQLIENNLVFCNRTGGVFVVQNTSPAMENNIISISRKVDGTHDRNGLLLAVQNAERVTSTDDSERYWLCVDGAAYVWDYTLSNYKNPTWFFFDNVYPVSFMRIDDKLYHLNENGQISAFDAAFSDYGEPFEKVFRFPVQTLGGFERLKDVTKMIFTMRGEAQSYAEIAWLSDYENRNDLTPIGFTTWRLVPRDLSLRDLSVTPFSFVAVRKPRCLHVRHFTARLYNNRPDRDMTVVSAQLFYKNSGKDR